MTENAFASQPLSPDLLSTLEDLKYHSMTKIQAMSLPDILAGHDLIGQAKTGSGKTAAFGLGILNRLDVKKFRVQTLVLCPTRELADQVANEIRTLGRKIHNIKVLTLCGGVPFGPQKGSLEHGAHIVVGTPGRIEDHLRKQNLILDNVTSFVLDEADRMLDMGFQDVIDKISSYLPEQRQTLLFSATFPSNIKQLASQLMKNPTHVRDESGHDTKSLRQILCTIQEKSDRTRALLWLLEKHQPESALVFCNTRQITEEVADALKQRGHSALPIHGELEQRDRDQRLIRFSNRSLSVLIATDVAARGLDIDELDLVVNYHLSPDPEIHIHRIGRTGRAGHSGVACSIAHTSEAHKIEMIEAEPGQTFERTNLGETHKDYRPEPPRMVTLQIDGGKRQKLRPGDILGALTGKDGFAGNLVGKINIANSWAFVAVDRAVWKQALALINNGKVKGKTFRARKL